MGLLAAPCEERPCLGLDIANVIRRGTTVAAVADSMIEVYPQPRIDGIVEGVDGVRRRRTEYAGTIWFGGHPKITSMGTMSMTRNAQIETPVFLPDSLPYLADRLADAALQVTVGLVNANDHAYLFGTAARFVPDPGGRPVWVQLHIQAAGPVPLAYDYRIVALTGPDAVEVR